MSKELNKAPVEQAEPASCQGTNCGTTTGDHSSECLAEAAAGQGWELKPGDLCGRDCPMRPDPVEQAGGDERVKCAVCVDSGKVYDISGEGPWKCYACTGSHEVIGYANGDELDNMLDDRTAVLSPVKTSFHTVPVYREARAALAQPSPASDLDPFNLAPHAEAFNEAPDEALRPEQAGGDERGALQELIRVRDWVKNRRGQPEKLKNTGQTYIMI
ncbi:hypothetical protein QK325_06370, partial [Pseudomonas aeruginosa]|nr:hypothetical protein [Pseudomonas aeruginosa]